MRSHIWWTLQSPLGSEAINSMIAQRACSALLMQVFYPAQLPWRTPHAPRPVRTNEKGSPGGYGGRPTGEPERRAEMRTTAHAQSARLSLKPSVRLAAMFQEFVYWGREGK